jgi:hypothetical protein
LTIFEQRRKRMELAGVILEKDGMTRNVRRFLDEQKKLEEERRGRVATVTEEVKEVTKGGEKRRFQEPIGKTKE